MSKLSISNDVLGEKFYELVSFYFQCGELKVKPSLNENKILNALHIEDSGMTIARCLVFWIDISELHKQDHYNLYYKTIQLFMDEYPMKPSIHNFECRLSRFCDQIMIESLDEILGSVSSQKQQNIVMNLGKILIKNQSVNGLLLKI